MPDAPRDTKAFLKQARERFEQGQTASHKQRQRVLDDLAFYAGGDAQWDKDALQSRRAQAGGQNGLPPVPARPVITINKVREPVHQVINQERQSDMGIQLVPADDWGDLAPAVSEEEIELREGLIRRIQRESQAADARLWAFTRAAIAGEGYYRVLTRYVAGKTWDKDVYITRIYNQASVTLDPSHEQPDGSDAEWGFIGGDVPWDRYKREYARNAKDQPNPNADDDMFRALGEEYPGWFTETGSTRSARVVEYFYTEWDTKTLVRMVDGAVYWEDELPDDFPEDAIVDTREEPQKTIKWAKIDATQILEETDWEGPDLPIIKVVGEELQPWDTERRSEGMVRAARDAQQGYNAMVSKWVESVGLAPIPPFQVWTGQVENFEAWYQVSNTRTLPYLPANLLSPETGQPFPSLPTRTNVDTPIQAIAQSVQMFDEAIKSTTMVPSVQLGQGTDAHLKSGKAIDSLKEQGLLGTSHLLDNLKRSIRYEGQIVNNLLFPIYGRPGRLARLLTGENEPQSVRISAPMNGNGGMPNVQPVQGPPGMAPGALPDMGTQGGGPPSGQMGQPGAPPSPPAPPKQKTYTLTKDANFNVIVKVSRNWESRREDESGMIGSLIDKNPLFMSWFGDLWLKYQDGPGHDEMADRAEVMLDPKIQSLRASKQQGNGDFPPEAIAQIAAMKKQLDDAHQVMQQAQAELKDKADQHQRELAAKKEIAQLEIASKEKIASVDQQNKAADREVKLAVAELTATVKNMQLFLEERQRLGTQVHEAVQNELDRRHEIEQTQLGHAHALEQGAQSPPVDPNRPPPAPDGAP